MRGKASPYPFLCLRDRITPAYAGKRHLPLTLLHRCQDHPRLCGEKKHKMWRYSNFIGSPPPMRGKASYVCPSTKLYRITPAYAGKSSGEICGYNGYKDHPRLCGEKVHSIHQLPQSVGSPPPMRGKEIRKMEVSTLRGITPAYAGKRNPRSELL